MNKTLTPLQSKAVKFLYESNKIEDEYDADSLMQAVYAWEWLITQSRLTHSVILKVHKILMLHKPLMPHQRGYYRSTSQVNVTIGGRVAPAYFMVEGMMDNWLLDYQELGWKNAHIRFEKIHPFVDGNGRTGRMLMNWQRLQEGRNLMTIMADEKQDYYQWFRE